jgi:hypothetical protein
MNGNAYCVWCNSSYVAAKATTVRSEGICWDCVQRECPGLFKSSDRAKLYGGLGSSATA